MYQQFEGKDSYPGRGKQEVKNGETYELTIAVRDRQVNAWVNGQFRLAARLPIPRRGGRLAVSTYLATVDFFAFSFNALDPAAPLYSDLASGKLSKPPGGELTRADLLKSISVEKKRVLLKAKSLEVLKLEANSLKSRVAAERARLGLDKADAKSLATRAAADQQRHEIAAAELALEQAEDDLAAGAGDEADKEGKKDKQDKKTAMLRKNVEQARKTLKQKRDARPGSSYKQLGKQYPRQSSGRRSALARWITGPSNPLAAIAGQAPSADYDRDGIPNDKDDCPTDHGNAANKGCPGEPRDFEQADQSGDPALAMIRGSTIVLRLPLLFESGSAALSSGMEKLVASLAGVIKDLPEDKHVIVRGHTDNAGARGANMRLSKRRAATVIVALNAQGVAKSRLRQDGVGPDVPIASNATPAGRARNRRVEFVIVDAKHPR